MSDASPLVIRIDASKGPTSLEFSLNGAWVRIEVVGGKAEKAKPFQSMRMACDWLRNYLGSDAVYARKLLLDGNAAGFGNAILFRAMKEVGAVSGGPRGGKFYRIADPAEAASTDQ